MEKMKATMEEVEKMVEAGDADSLSAVLHEHYGNSDDVRECAGRALLALDRRRALAGFVDGLGPDISRPLSRRILQELGSEVFDTLVDFSESEEFQNKRWGLAQAFDAVGDVRGFDVLLPRVKAARASRGRYELEAIMEAFTCFREERCYEPALDVLQSDIEDCCYRREDITEVKNAAAKAMAVLGREDSIAPILEYVMTHATVGNVTGGVRALCDLLNMYPERIPECMPQLLELPAHEDFRKHYDGKLRHLDPYPFHGDEYHYTNYGVKDLRGMLRKLPGRG